MSNREATRDAWFRLLREASSAAGRSSGLRRDNFGSSHILQDPGIPVLTTHHMALLLPAQIEQHSRRKLISWQGKSVAQEGWRQRMRC